MNSTPLRTIITGTSLLKLRAHTHRLKDHEEGLFARARQKNPDLPLAASSSIDFVEASHLARQLTPGDHLLACLDTTPAGEIEALLSAWAALPLSRESARIMVPEASVAALSARFPALAPCLLGLATELDFPSLLHIALDLLISRPAQVYAVPAAKLEKHGSALAEFDPLLSQLLDEETIVAGAILNSRCGTLHARHRKGALDPAFDEGLSRLLQGASRLGLDRMDEAILSYPEHYFICATIPSAPHLVCGIVVDKQSGSTYPAMEKIRLRHALTGLQEQELAAA